MRTGMPLENTSVETVKETAQSGRSRTGLRSWFWRGLKIAVLILAVVFLLSELARNLEALSQLEENFKVAYAGFALLLLLTGFALLPLVSQEVLAGLGYPLGYRTMFRAYFGSQLMKYLPGGFWIVPGRVVALRNAGVDPIASSLGVLLESLVLLLTGAIVYLPYGLWDAGGHYLMLSVALIGGCLLALLSLRLSPILKILRRLLPSFFLHNTVRIPAGSMLRMVLIGIAFWLLAGSGFHLIAACVEPLPLNMWLLATPAFAMAWVVGFLAFLTPGGLGVREAVLVWLLTPSLPRQAAVFAALLARLWWLVAEVVAISASAFVGRRPGQGRGKDRRHRSA
jgi:uncharacterized membrane protein YbhN (UPF0104 family)